MRRGISVFIFISIIFIVFYSAYSNSSQTKNPAKRAINKTSHIDAQKLYLLKSTFELRKRCNDFFTRQFNMGNFSGTVLIGYKGEVIYRGAFGYANRKQKMLMTPQHIFQIGSMSKQFTAISILQLVASEKLSLNDTVNKFYPDFPYHGITIRMLLTHRSGLPNYIYQLENSSIDKTKPVSNQEMVDYMIKHKEKAYSKPGRHYQYSNTGYALLAAIIEKVSGMSFSEYVHKHIFEPLGMNHSFFYTDIFENKINASLPIATGYLSPRQESGFYYLNGILGDKGLFTTIDDLHTWDTSLYHHYILPINYIDSALTKQTKTRLSLISYGFGWKMYFLKDTFAVYFHSGWWQGYQSVIMHIPHDTVTVVILKNKKTGHPIDQRAMIDLIYPGNNLFNRTAKKNVFTYHSEQE